MCSKCCLAFTHYCHYIHRPINISWFTHSALTHSLPTSTNLIISHSLNHSQLHTFTSKHRGIQSLVYVKMQQLTISLLWCRKHTPTTQEPTCSCCKCITSANSWEMILVQWKHTLLIYLVDFSKRIFENILRIYILSKARNEFYVHEFSGRKNLRILIPKLWIWINHQSWTQIFFMEHRLLQS